MNFSTLLVLAFGLAIDATAVSAARGIAVPTLRFRHVFLVAAFFGGFQALMPFLGYLAGKQMGPHVQAWDHWIAFTLLSTIGAKMLWEARHPSSESRPAGDPFALGVMLLLAVATSIDAFAAGITLPLLNAPFALSLVTIGLLTALMSSLGLLAGRRFGALLGPRLEIFGGLVLIGLGVKILADHLRV